MKMHVNQLSIDQLDYLAAEKLFGSHESSLAVSCPASHWEDGGHALQELFMNGMELKKCIPLGGEPAKVMASMTQWQGTVYFGNTLLEAAMRCLLGHETGGIIDIPDHLA